MMTDYSSSWEYLVNWQTQQYEAKIKRVSRRWQALSVAACVVVGLVAYLLGTHRRA